MTTFRATPAALLVHDAFDDTSAWSGVIAALDRRGIDATALANPLAGLRRDAAYVASVAATTDGPVVLAGHGYGGAVIGVAADRCANVVALVLVAAFAPDVGERCLDLVRWSGDARPLEALQPAIVQRDDGPTTVEATVRRGAYRELVAADLPGEQAAVLAAQQRGLAAAALEEAATTAAWRRLPTTYVVATGDRLIGPQAQRWMAERVGGDTVVLDAAHAVTRSRAEDVAEVIAGAAGRAVG